jgi:DHA3 family tetracycline resistance protein-like MFS transporter
MAFSFFPRVRKRRAAPVYHTVQFVFGLAFSTIVTVNLVYQATVAGLTPAQLILVGTTLEVTAFLFELPTGVLADRVSRRLSVIIGYALFGLGFLIEGLFPALFPILLAQVVWGIGITFISGAQEAWLIDELNAESSGAEDAVVADAGGVMVRGGQWGNLGGLLGIGLSTLLAVAFGVAVPIVVGAVTLLVLAFVLALFMPEQGFRPAAQPVPVRFDVFRSVMRTLRAGFVGIGAQPILWLVVGVLVVSGLYSEGFDRLWTPHLLDNIGLPSLGSLDPVVWFGVLRALTMASTIAVAEGVARWKALRSGRTLLTAITLSDGVLIISLLAFALAGNFAVAALFFVVSQTVRGALMPLFRAWSNRFIAPEVRATTLSMFGQLDAIGQIGGGVGMAAVTARVGVRAALVVSAFLLTPVLVFYTLAARRADADGPIVEEP